MKATVVILIFTLCMWLFEDPVPLQSQVTIYRLDCAGKRTDRGCIGREETVTPYTYRASTSQQDVIYWKGGGDLPEKYTDCTVRDARNWYCKVPGSEPNEYQMKSGEFHRVWDHDGVVMSEFLYAVPKWYWWLTRLAEMTR
jgi:hypothetical protein